MSPPHPATKRTMIEMENNNIFSQNASEADSEDCSSKKRMRLLSFLDNMKNYQKDSENLHVITCLDLSHCNLTGVPNTLRLLPLKDLNVSHNNLTQVPTCLYHNGLANLEKLDLSYNAIEYFDVIPDCVGSLKTLYLNNNRFSSLPRWILNFYSTKLEVLDYSENRAEHYNFSEHICNFNVIYLRDVRLICACLIDKDIGWLKLVRSLQYLNISNRGDMCEKKHNNNFKELGRLFSYPSWKEMKTLQLCALSIAILPEELFWIDTITELHLSNNVLSWIPDDIKYLVHLQVLDVSNNQIMYLPDTLDQLPNLAKFIAFGNHLDELPVLPKSLQYLDLYDNDLSTLRNINLERLSYIDLELNFIDIEASDGFFLSYVPKRDQLRTICGAIVRGCGVKTSKTSEDSHSYTSERHFSLDDDEFTFEEEQDSTGNYAASEDWDQEWNEETEKSPEVMSDDDEFTGADERINISKSKMPKTNFYIDVNEQWIFEDAD